MTDPLDAIRARHVSWAGQDRYCAAPDDRRWPCDAATLLAALDEARAELGRMTASRDALMYERAQAVIRGEREATDAALADADRLAGALERFMTPYTYPGTLTTEPGHSTFMVAVSEDDLIAARSALAAHEASGS